MLKIPTSEVDVAVVFVPTKKSKRCSLRWTRLTQTASYCQTSPLVTTFETHATVQNIGLDEAIDIIVASERIVIESCDCESVGANAANVSVAPLLGIVGALASRVSVPVANLGRVFRVPQISYGSTSPRLNNRNRHSYFYRTIPPDDLQAKAMVELMLYFNWTHISTIYSNDAYGQPAIAEFTQAS